MARYDISKMDKETFLKLERFQVEDVYIENKENKIYLVC